MCTLLNDDTFISYSKADYHLKYFDVLKIKLAH